MSSLSTSLKNSYQRWLHPYEEYLRTAKPGVQQQLELENGGPYEHSPAYSPAKVSVNAPLGPKETISQPSALPPVEAPRALPPRPIPGSGFTAVNAGGFSAVNAPPGFVAVNNAPQPIVKREEENRVVGQTTNGQHQTTYNILPPNYTHTTPSGPFLANGTGSSNPLKRTMSHDSLNAESGSDGGDGDNGNGRRSKRIKKGIVFDSRVLIYNPRFHLVMAVISSLNTS